MDEALFTEILKKIRLHAKYLYFHVMGEPLLHPKLGRFLELCDIFGYQVNLTTNGTLIGEAGETLRSKPALRQVSFSLHSFEANDSPDSLDDYLNRIFAFIHDSQKERPLFISLKLWNSGDRRGEGRNAAILQRIQDEFSMPEQPEDRATTTGIKITRTVFLNQAEPFSWPDPKNPDLGDRGFCLGLRDQVAILVDGTVVPCCLDGAGVIDLGNIQEKGLQEILNGPRAKALYEGFSQRRIAEPLCRKCSYRKRFDSGTSTGSVTGS
jgi:radical SAM protein with 4Fe4S-binding SPASM domain